MRSLRSLLPLPAAVLATALVTAPPARAVGAPFLVKDIYPGSTTSTPRNLLSLGNRLFFFADDGTSGLEPWASDGTLAGTIRLADIRPGLDGSPTTAGATAAGGIAAFASTDGNSSREVWRTDGTPAGTFLLDDQSVPFGFGTGGSTLYFAGSEGDISLALLHVSDGTFAGTHVVATNVFLTGQDMLDVNGREFFSADEGSHGTEIWSSDGTSGGTHLVADLNPGSAGSAPGLLTNVNGMLYFFVETSGPNFGLCRSDGTDPGTFLLKAINPNFSAQDGNQIVNLNGTAYVIAKDATHGAELWKSDGTVAGTVLVKDINPGAGDGIVRSGLAVLGNYVYFGADDGVHGPELWRSDGTAAGTQMFDEIYPGSGGSFPLYLRTLDGYLFFTALDFDFNTTPWISDGTVGGTHSLGNVLPGDGTTTRPSFTFANGYVFFTGRDDTHGFEVWAVATSATTAVGTGASPRNAGLALSSPAPNPMRGVATLLYTLPAAGRVRLTLFDVTGREQRVVADGVQSSGRHQVSLDAGGLAAGLYFWRLESAGEVVQRKALVVR